MTKEIGKILDKPVFLPNIPEFIMKAMLGEMSYLLFASQRVSSKSIETEGFKFKYTTVCLALEEIYNENSPKKEAMSSYTKEYI